MQLDITTTFASGGSYSYTAACEKVPGEDAPEEEAASTSAADDGPGQESASSIRPGDQLLFGRYDQDANAGNGAEPIPWIVLDVEDGLATLMSRDVLEARAYNGLGMRVTWDGCSLRKWLNGSFLDSAFDDAERAALETVTVTADINPEYPDADPGADTEDTVYLLSVVEAVKYFGALHIPPAMPTETAIANGVYVSNVSGEQGQSLWWLRSPGSYSDSAAYVVTSNDLQDGGNDVSKTNYGVRPVVKAKLSALESLSSPVEKAELDYPEELEEVGADAASYVEGDAEAFAALSAGDTILFGRYDQDNDPENGAEGIEWIVLDVRDGTATLMTRYVLDARAFNGLGMYLSWDECSLRQWLNGAFLNDSFTEEERAVIRQTTVTADVNPMYPDAETGADTEDRVYLLSINEAAEYFGNISIAPGLPTRTAVANGIYVSNTVGSIGTTTWWLRTTGGYDDRAAYIHSSNELNGNGDENGCTDNGIRPVINVDVAALPGLARVKGTEAAGEVPEEPAAEAPDAGEEYAGDEAGTVEEQGSEPESAPVDEAAEASGDDLPWSVGSVVTFGRYEQDNDIANGPEPIEWLVLEAEADARLLIARYGLYPTAYDDDATATWETSDVREWLNSVWLNTAFNANEQALIIESSLENADNPEYGTDGGSDTVDRVFLLSIDEMERCFPIQEDRATVPTAYAEAEGAYVDGENGCCWWWLRSPGQDQSQACIVNADGFSGGIYQNIGTLYVGEKTSTSNDCIRPAIWVFPPADGEIPAEETLPKQGEGAGAAEEADEAPDEGPSSAVTAEDVLNALNDDTYRATYDALLAGEVIQKGSRGDAAKGVQQTLVAFGQGIAVDGDVGPKTIAALNAVQTAFGLEQTEALDADGYAQLLPRLLIATDPDGADALLAGQMDAGEYAYLRACALVAQGKYASARALFAESGWDDWEARAEACVQPWPSNGVLYKNPAVKGSSTELTVKFNTDPDTAMLVKIYTTDDVLARTMFIGGTGKATCSLPAGTYIIKDGTGHDWYGEEEAFGSEGYYEIMTFGDGQQEVQLKKNYSSTITVNVQEDNPDAQGVGSDWESWGDF